jgi:hypothetical protein
MSSLHTTLRFTRRNVIAVVVFANLAVLGSPAAPWRVRAATT